MRSHVEICSVVGLSQETECCGEVGKAMRTQSTHCLQYVRRKFTFGCLSPDRTLACLLPSAEGVLRVLGVLRVPSVLSVLRGGGCAEGVLRVC